MDCFCFGNPLQSVRIHGRSVRVVEKITHNGSICAPISTKKPFQKNLKRKLSKQKFPSKTFALFFFSFFIGIQLIFYFEQK